MEPSAHGSIDSFSLDLSEILVPDCDVLTAKCQFGQALDAIQVKLEAATNLVNMLVESNGVAVSESIPRLFLFRQQLQQLFCRIDGMCQFVSTVERQLNQLETQLAADEQRLGVSSALSAFSALFQPARPAQSSLDRSSRFTSNDVYNTEDFFHQRFPPASTQD